MLVIGKPSQVGADFHPLPSHPHMTPREIRAEIRAAFHSAEEGEEDKKYVTTHPTVLDEVRAMTGVWSYEDVYLVYNDALVPLLSAYEEDYLQHFNLGDLLSHEHFEEGVLRKRLGG